LHIHEDDLLFQQKVREMYLWQVEENEDFRRIDCIDKKGNMRSPSEISTEILSHIEL
jgi:uncharacterized protein YnzC (UPF0291/DUF896 family)